MSARSFSQRPAIGPVSFSLSKFSFATVSGESVRPIPWTHISDKGHLFAIFENVSVQSYNGEIVEKSQFKVLAEQEVMEDLDLRSLGREAMKAAQDMKRLPVPSKFPTVTVIIQEPCIAVRFPLQYGQIRRFQMKFKLASDFYKALSLFSQAQCPFTQAVPTAPQGKVPGLLSASPAVPPFGSGYLARDNLRSAPSMVDSDRRTCVSTLGTSMYSSSRPSTAASSTWRPEKGVQSYSTQACASMDLACSAVPLVSPFFSKADRPPVILKPVMEEHDTCRPIEHKSQQDHFFPSSSDPLTGFASTAVNRRHGTSQTTSVSEAPRPSTAPNLASQSLSQMLPPKRELPFKVSKTTSVTTRALRSRQGPSDELVNSSDNSTGGSLGSVTRASEHTNKVTPGLPTKLAVKRPSKSTRATRKTVAGPRSRNKASVLDKDPPVPSVEELLLRSRELSVKQGSTSAEEKDADKASGTVTAPAITQVGVDLKNEVRWEGLATEDGRLQQTEKRLTTDHFQRQQHVKRKDFTYKDGESMPVHPSKRAALDAPLGWAALHPLGGNGQKSIDGSSEAAIEIADRRVQDASTVSNANFMDANHSGGRRESHETCHSAPKPVEEIAAAQIDYGKIRSRGREPLADISDVSQPERSYNFASRSLRALMSDPAFAKSPEMADWTELSPEERDAALEMWMCQQLESDNFAALMKTLEGMWQRIFFGQ